MINRSGAASRGERPEEQTGRGRERVPRRRGRKRGREKRARDRDPTPSIPRSSAPSSSPAKTRHPVARRISSTAASTSSALATPPSSAAATRSTSADNSASAADVAMVRAPTRDFAASDARNTARNAPGSLANAAAALASASRDDFVTAPSHSRAIVSANRPNAAPAFGSTHPSASIASSLAASRVSSSAQRPSAPSREETPRDGIVPATREKRVEELVGDGGGARLASEIAEHRRARMAKRWRSPSTERRRSVATDSARTSAESDARRSSSAHAPARGRGEVIRVVSLAPLRVDDHLRPRLVVDGPLRDGDGGAEPADADEPRATSSSRRHLAPSSTETNRRRRHRRRRLESIAPTAQRRSRWRARTTSRIDAGGFRGG